jgi:7-carboxy-7-deazaguanine synthase
LSAVERVDCNPSLAAHRASGIRSAEKPSAEGRGGEVRPGEDRLKVTEIFHSLQGEALFSGWPTVFVRLTGCPLRCQYCDTAYAFTGGEWRTIGQIVAGVRRFATPRVCVTGGEPLAQRRCFDLLTTLCDAGFEVSLETSGAIDIAAVDPRVSRVVDVKTPGSREAERNRAENFEHLAERDALKFVLCDRADYEWARNWVRRWIEGRGDLPCPVFFSPSFEELEARALADWILEDALPVRLQLQLHKLLWGNVPGR